MGQQEGDKTVPKLLFKHTQKKSLQLNFEFILIILYTNYKLNSYKNSNSLHNTHCAQAILQSVFIACMIWFKRVFT